MSREWVVPEGCFFNGEWEQQRLVAYSRIIEQRERRPNFSIQYSTERKGYVCPHCPTFVDRNIDVVVRHSLHCGEKTISREPRGWWPNGRRTEE